MSPADRTVPPLPGEMGEHAAPTSPWQAALETAVELAEGRCTKEDVDRLRELRDHVVERMELGDGITVAALAGGTGVGKSALANRLAGTEVVVEGIRRPTTDHPVAITSRLDAPTRRLLDWLVIDDRREVAGTLPDGLVLVDLPDHDSVAELHRTTSQRLAARVDVLLVVVDPVKYARADLHDGPLASLWAHAEVVTVVLNRCDELEADDVARLREDLAARLEADGLGAADLHTTSAATGAGIAALTDHLADLARERQAVVARLAADAAVVAEDVLSRAPTLPATPVAVPPLVDAALEAADGHRAVVVAELEQRDAGRQATRSPLARMVRAPVQLAARLGRGLGFGAGAADTSDRQAAVRSHRTLARRLAEEVDLASTVGHSHAGLDRAVEQAAEQAAPRVVAAVSGVADEVAAERRRWWPAMAGARGLAEATAVVGFSWLLLLRAVAWLGLPEPTPPQVTDRLSWPAALLLAGLGVRVLLGLLTRVSLRVAASRVRSRTTRRLTDRLSEVVTDHLVAPYDAEVAATSELRAALTTLVSGRRAPSARPSSSPPTPARSRGRR